MAERDEPGITTSQATLSILAGIRLDEGVRQVMEREGVNRVEAVRAIYALLKEEEITLRDPEPPRGFRGYILSLYSWWFWALLGAVASTLLSIYLLPQSEPWIYLRYLSGAVYVLYLPGASLIEALYPKREDLEDLERFALSIGLSLALVPLVGLVLNYTPWGIRLDPIFASLSLLTMALSLAGVVRKHEYHMMRVESAGFRETPPE